MTIISPIRALTDNYIWAMHSPDNCTLSIVDPGAASPVISYLNGNNLTLESILVTHHHADHTAGIPILLEHYPNIRVFGPADNRIPHVTHPIKEGDEIALFNHTLSLSVLEIPGHTQSHIAYYSPQFLFCGDTLFSCGCGRLFEGTAAQLFSSLKKIQSLNPNTLIYCAHEYTLANIAFAKHVFSNNSALEARYQEALSAHYQGLPTLPVSLKTEMETNPFLRCDDPNIIASVQKKFTLSTFSESEIFACLRQWKDHFTPPQKVD